MNEVAKIEPRSVTRDMADRYGMETAAFEATLRATVFPATASREQFAAFLLVAKHYNLNPVTKEIYAFPAKGGIVPIVSIDGWMNLINSHPAFDGMEFDELHSDDGKLIATRCTIHRKDRGHPISVTEYFEECRRATDPWKMQHRMLRHKAAIQCARYAFGFAGIYDEDEGERIVATMAQRPERPVPPVPPARRSEPATVEHQPVVQMEIAGELLDEPEALPTAAPMPESPMAPEPAKPPLPPPPPTDWAKMPADCWPKV